jgi:hypothetical protein
MVRQTVRRERLVNQLSLFAARGTQAFRDARSDNLEDVVDQAVVAYVDRRGTRWSLSSWVTMNATTIGRQASTRGLTDAAGDGAKVTVEVGECGYCQEFAREAIVGQDPLPPFHPSCTCVART